MKKITKEFIKFAAKEKFLEKESGGWCVRCALGNAKNEFDEEHKKYAMPFGEALKDLATGIREMDYDMPLVEARNYLASKNFDLLFPTKKQAIRFMLNALKF